MTDCIIIGAGPAGTAAAYHLARRGLNVLILEKGEKLGSKSCGGGVSPAVAAWFDFDFAPAIATTVDQVRFTWQQGDPVAAQLQTQPMWMVQRPIFDQFLLNQAETAGAKVQMATAVTGLSFDGQAWQVATHQGMLTAPYVIAADGAGGPCAAWLGLKGMGKGAIAAVAALVEPPKFPHQAQFDFGSVKNGFIWQFPQGDRSVVSAAVMEGNSKPAELAQQLGQYLGNGATVTAIPMNLWHQQRPLHGQNCLLVGDSAGLADPFLAEGIRPALLSGVKAAEAIAAAHGGDAQALARYSETMQTLWGHDMALAQRLAGLFYKFTKLAYKIGVKQPLATRLMSQILCGELSYSAVTDRAFRALKKNLLPFG
ncbi:geranylgeranyl reductase family protein [Spirulina sp. CCNP1310]|uniref:NAD(P)/FAD-dependent oxidoreductase n=1 Tax=Spirulina sp. CCNP1310 TaxID=3110249 RepID=UPI002B21CA59|nr:geranylgeranyl reductase family protein [Spirulina sp. CCNP1310]MEA5421321.1 geranylgeranyl reductase family protein [Spirulina sp. CCNP1310]